MKILGRELGDCLTYGEVYKMIAEKTEGQFRCKDEEIKKLKEKIDKQKDYCEKALAEFNHRQQEQESRIAALENQVKALDVEAAFSRVLNAHLGDTDSLLKQTKELENHVSDIKRIIIQNQDKIDATAKNLSEFRVAQSRAAEKVQGVERRLENVEGLTKRNQDKIDANSECITKLNAVVYAPKPSMWAQICRLFFGENKH